MKFFGVPRSRKSFWRHTGHRLVRLVRAAVLLEDTPHRIALGSAIGLFYSVQPFVGSQMAAAALTAKVLRGSVFASLPWTWLSNPITGPPLYYACYRIGRCFWPDDDLVTYERVASIFARAEGHQGTLIERFKELMHLLGDIALQLQIGACVLSILLALIGFPLVRRLVEKLQIRRRARRSRWKNAIATPLPADAAAIPAPTTPPVDTP